MGNQESPEPVPTPGDGPHPALAEDRPWFFRIAEEVYVDRTLRYQLYARLIFASFMTVSISWWINPAVGFGMLVYAVLTEKAHLERYTTRIQINDLYQKLGILVGIFRETAQMVPGLIEKVEAIQQRLLQVPCEYRDFTADEKN